MLDWLFNRRTQNKSPLRTRADVISPQEATGTLVVKRFQGNFQCGCKWPKDVFAPEECPDHPGSEKVYVDEPVMQMENVTVGRE